MLTTTSRPAPLPRRQPVAAGPLPVGAVRMSRTYLDDRGRPQIAEQPVPVGADDRRTGHARYGCPHRVEVDGQPQPCDTVTWLLPGQDAPHCPHPEHRGAKLVAAERRARDPLLPWGQVGVALRPNLPAVAALAVEAAAGIGVAVSGVPVVAVAAIAPPVLSLAAHRGVSVFLRRRAERRGRIGDGQESGRRVETIRRRARAGAYLGAGAGAWLAAVAAVDLPSLPARLVWSALPVAWAVGSRTWTRYTARFVDRQPVEAPTPVVEVPESPDVFALEMASRWRERVAKSGGALPGTDLVEVQRLPGAGNWKARITSIPGDLDLSELPPRAIGRIASAYRADPSDVTIDGFPGDASQAVLIVQPDNPLSAVQHWDGPDREAIRDRGLSLLGRYTDGEPAWYLWFNGGGPWHDLICGATGGGKSELVAMLLLTELLTADDEGRGLMLSWVADPQQGQSYGELQDLVDWFARDMVEIRLMLLAAVKEMRRRNRVFSRRRQKTWRPTAEFPLLVVTIDEAHEVLKDPICLQLVEKLANMARKCGIKLRIITQVPLLSQLGGSTPIKDALVSGQTIIFRTGSAISGQVAVQGAADIYPHRLPRVWPKHSPEAGKTTAGLGYLLGTETRNARMRTMWPGEHVDRWIRDESGTLLVTPGAMSPEAVGESGPLWAGRRARAEAMASMPLSDQDILPGGIAVEMIQAAAAFQFGVAGKVAGVEESGRSTGGRKAADVVLAAAVRLADGGRVERTAIAAQVNVPDRTLTKALTDLVKDGLLARGGDIPYGSYAVTDKGKLRAGSVAEQAVQLALDGDLEQISE